MSTAEPLYPKDDPAQVRLAGFLRRQAYQASSVGLRPYKTFAAARVSIAIALLVLGGALFAVTVVPLPPLTLLWATRAIAALIVVPAVLLGRGWTTRHFLDTTIHLRLWTLCERCIELLSANHDAAKVHEYYLMRRSEIERTGVQKSILR